MAEHGTMPWSLKGVSREARQAAREAARKAGLPMGAWLSRVIRAAAMAEGVAPATPADGDSLIERAMARIESDLALPAYPAGRADD